jgi:DNA polymerase-3 subunit beta
VNPEPLLKICAGELAALLQASMPAVPSLSTLPILKHVLVRLSDNAIAVTASNLEFQVEVVAVAEYRGDPTAFTFPARKVHDICNSLPEDSLVTISLTSSHVQMRAGRGRYKVERLPAEDFPGMDVDARESKAQFMLPVTEMKTAIEQVIGVPNPNDVRTFCWGVAWECRAGEVKLKATNGTRLAQARFAATEAATEDSRKFVLTLAAMKDILRLASNGGDIAALCVGQSTVEIKFKGVTAQAKVLDTAFPDVDGYFQLPPRFTARLPVDAFRTLIQRSSFIEDPVAMFAFDQGKADIVTWPGHQGAIVQEYDNGLEIQVIKGGREEIYLRPKQTLEILKTMGEAESVQLDILENGAALFLRPGVEQLVMPLRPDRIPLRETYMHEPAKKSADAK